jgi:hypothetical protein
MGTGNRTTYVTLDGRELSTLYTKSIHELLVCADVCVLSAARGSTYWMSAENSARRQAILGLLKRTRDDDYDY